MVAGIGAGAFEDSYLDFVYKSEINFHTAPHIHG